jgi:guanylate kinase
MQIMQKLPEAVSIFIMPPTPEVLERRLRNRSEAERMTSEDVIGRRLREAQKELDRLGEYKYAIVNDDLDVAVSEMKAIVLTERRVAEADTELAASCLTSERSARLVHALGCFKAAGEAGKRDTEILASPE